MSWSRSPRLRKVAAFCEALLMLSFSACSSMGFGKKTPTPEPPSDFKVSVTVPEPPKPLPPAQPEPAQPQISVGPKPPDATPAPVPGTQAPTGPMVPAPEGKPPAALDPAATLGARNPRFNVVPPAAQPPAAPAPGAQGPSGDATSGTPTGGPVDRGPAVRVRQAQTQTSERPAGTPPTAQAPGRLVVFNFDNADIEIVLQATSELLVFNYVLAPEARGKKVTVQTTGRIPVDDIFPVLLTILDVNGLAAIKSGSVYRIIAKQGAPQTSTRTVVGAQLEPLIPGDEVLTQIIPLKFVNAVEVAGLLRPFVPQQGAISAHRDTNLLVVTDVAANIRRLLDIVKLLDVDVTTSELQIVALKFADAQEVAQILTQLFASGRLRATGPQLPAGITPPAPAAPAAPGAAPVRPATPGPTSAGSDSSQDRPPLIVPERRSNSLIIYARKQEMETISRLIEKLDADIYGGQRIFFYFCENTKARDLAATLDAIFGRGSGAAPSQASPSSSAPGARPAGGLPTQSQIQPTRGASGTTGRPGGPGGLLEELAGGVGAETRFIPDEATNSIIVTTYPRVWGEIESLLKKLDRSPRQVLIEVLVAEVTLDDSTSLGISWAVQHGRYGATFTGFNPPSGGGGANLPGRLPELLPGLISGGGLVPTGLSFVTFATNEFLLAINALAAANRVNVLSSPSVMTTENKKAVINVSQSVPVVTSQQVPIGGTVTTGVAQTTSVVGTQTVEYRDVGIVLTVTPRIGEQGTVSLEVKQEVNDILTESFGTTGSPAFTKREAETSVVLLNNQTLVLGGLIQNRRTVDKVGIPYLNKIPILGYAFGNTTEVTRKVELVLLITPRVVGTALDASRITDQMRRITPEIKESIRDKQFPYPSFEYMKP